jgi:hypothetical protein
MLRFVVGEAKPNNYHNGTWEYQSLSQATQTDVSNDTIYLHLLPSRLSLSALALHQIHR